MDHTRHRLTNDKLGLAISTIALRANDMLSTTGLTPVSDCTGGNTRERLDLANWAAVADLLAGGATLNDASYAKEIHPALANQILDTFAKWQPVEDINTSHVGIGRTLTRGLEGAARTRITQARETQIRAANQAPNLRGTSPNCQMI